MAKILGLPFDDYVKKQVDVRQKRLSKSQKSPQDLTVFNSNTSWVRLTSSVKIEESRAKDLSSKLGISKNLVLGNKLARNLILWNGVSSVTPSNDKVILDKLKGGIGYGLNNAYGFLSNSAQGLQPPPGIESISCNYKNNGTLKQAQIKLKCFTRPQFEAIEAVYLRLGYTMILEWGNALYFDNNEQFNKITGYSIPNLLYKSEGDVDPAELQTQLESNKKATSGNYDGMLAKVSNYSWTIQEDLSFSITIDLVSLGDIIDSLKVNIGGVTNSTPTPSNITFSGSVENIATIQVNKNASKLNSFFYELYEEVYKEGLTSYQVSGKTGELIAKVDEITKLLTSGEWDITKEKITNALEEFRKYYKLVEEALPIFEKGNLTNYGNFPENSAASSEEQKRYFEIAKEFYGTEPSTRPNFYSLLSNKDDLDKAIKLYKDSLDKIEEFIDSETIGEDNLKKINGWFTDNTENQKNVVSVKKAIINALERGNFGTQNDFVKIEGSEFDDGTGDYRFTSVIERKFGIDG
jgi:hypothetical protein